MTDEEFHERWINRITYTLMALQISALISLVLLILRAILPFPWKWVAAPVLLGITVFCWGVIGFWASRSRRDFKRGLKGE